MIIHVYCTNSSVDSHGDTRVEMCSAGTWRPIPSKGVCEEQLCICMRGCSCMRFHVQTAIATGTSLFVSARVHVYTRVHLHAVCKCIGAGEPTGSGWCVQCLCVHSAHACASVGEQVHTGLSQSGCPEVRTSGSCASCAVTGVT